MKNIVNKGFLIVALFFCILCLQGTTLASESSSSLVEAFKQGTVYGQLKTYYYSQYFEGEGLNDSEIWVYGGNLGYKTARFYGFGLGATFQASLVGHKDDPDGKTRGSMDAEGAVLSEAYLSYNLSNTDLIGGRQYLKYPLLSGSGSRFIKESFEAYLLSNKDIPGTTVTAGLVTKYQTRSDQSNYSDNWFVDYETNGTGDVGDFYDIGDDGMVFLYAKNNSLDNLTIQAQYINVFDEVADFYADGKYTFNVQFNPYVAAQFYYTDYDDSMKDSNELWGFKGGAKFADFDVFAAFTTTGGKEGDARVFRGVGQGSYSVFTATTKSVGGPAYEADTESYQIGTLYALDMLSVKLLYSYFDNPAVNKDLDEYTLNFLYKFGGWAENLSFAVDFSVLDYEDDQKDAIDLRTKLTYSF